MAVDGTFLNLPRHKSIKEEFGSRMVGHRANFEKSLCLLSVLYDPANYMTIDVQCDHMDASEGELLLKQLKKVSAGDILMLDRGYPSRFLFSLFQGQHINFICRMNTKWLMVKKLMSIKPETEINGDTARQKYSLHSFNAHVQPDGNDQKFILTVSNPFSENLKITVCGNTSPGFSDKTSELTYRKRINMIGAEDGKYTLTVSSGKKTFRRTITLTSTDYNRNLALQ